MAWKIRYVCKVPTRKDKFTPWLEQEVSSSYGFNDREKAKERALKQISRKNVVQALLVWEENLK
jgi:hypothetical protein